MFNSYVSHYHRVHEIWCRWKWWYLAVGWWPGQCGSRGSRLGWACVAAWFFKAHWSWLNGCCSWWRSWEAGNSWLMIVFSTSEACLKPSEVYHNQFWAGNWYCDLLLEEIPSPTREHGWNTMGEWIRTWLKKLFWVVKTCHFNHFTRNIRTHSPIPA